MSFMGKFDLHTYDLIRNVYYNTMLKKSTSHQLRIARCAEIFLRETIAADIILIQIVSKHPCDPLARGSPRSVQDLVERMIRFLLQR